MWPVRVGCAALRPFVAEVLVVLLDVRARLDVARLVGPLLARTDREEDVAEPEDLEVNVEVLLDPPYDGREYCPGTGCRRPGVVGGPPGSIVSGSPGGRRGQKKSAADRHALAVLAVGRPAIGGAGSRRATGRAAGRTPVRCSLPGSAAVSRPGECAKGTKRPGSSAVASATSRGSSTSWRQTRAGLCLRVIIVVTRAAREGVVHDRRLRVADSSAWRSSPPSTSGRPSARRGRRSRR